MFSVRDLRPLLLDDRKYQIRDVAGPGCLYELKYDGYRVLAEFGAGAVEMRTRNGHDCTGWFPRSLRL